jgi:1,4-alpha-glucan branching enzyme
MELSRLHRLLNSPPARCLEIDASARILVAERAGLLFVFNFSPDGSRFGHSVPAPAALPYRVILDSDDPAFGGAARIDTSVHHPVGADGRLLLYSPCRSAQVFAPVSD